MSYEQVQAVVGTAIVDRAYLQTLLSSPAKAVQGFDLTTEEVSAITAIRAQSLDEFARKLHRWLTRPQRRRRSRKLKYGEERYLGIAV